MAHFLYPAYFEHLPLLRSFERAIIEKQTNFSLSAEDTQSTSTVVTSQIRSG